MTTCRICGVSAEGEEAEELFYRKCDRSPRGGRPDRLRTVCKECSKQRTTQWRRDNPEKWRAIHQRSQKKRKFHPPEKRRKE